MKVLYDHQIFSSQVYGGISRYFYELMCRFTDDAEVDFELALRYSNNSYLSGCGFVRAQPFFKKCKFTGKSTLLNFINGLKSKQSLHNEGFDLFHPTYYQPYYLPLVGKKPVVVTVYDMVHELYPELYPSDDKTRDWKRQSLQNAKKIIAISENTRTDLTRFYGIDPEKIGVIHLATSLSGVGASTLQQLPEKYILFVGQRMRYKNFPFFVRSVAPLLKNDKDLTVFCVGGGGFDAAEISLFESMGISDRFFQFQLHDDDLACVYRNARVFVFPSLYEGFGIPILEAFSCGCPVALSNKSCFPEVADDAALYFDPYDELSLRVVVEKLVYDECHREDLRSKGFVCAQKFSWTKTAHQTKAVYESLV